MLGGEGPRPVPEEGTIEHHARRGVPEVEALGDVLARDRGLLGQAVPHQLALPHRQDRRRGQQHAPEADEVTQPDLAGEQRHDEHHAQPEHRAARDGGDHADGDDGGREVPAARPRTRTSQRHGQRQRREEVEGEVVGVGDRPRSARVLGRAHREQAHGGRRRGGQDVGAGEVLRSQDPPQEHVDEHHHDRQEPGPPQQDACGTHRGVDQRGHQEHPPQGDPHQDHGEPVHAHALAAAAHHHPAAHDDRREQLGRHRLDLAEVALEQRGHHEDHHRDVEPQQHQAGGGQPQQPRPHQQRGVAGGQPEDDAGEHERDRQQDPGRPRHGDRDDVRDHGVAHDTSRGRRTASTGRRKP